MTGPAPRRRIAAPRLRTRGARDTGIRRIRLTLGIFGLLVLLTVGKLVEIQVFSAAAYAENSIRQRARTVDLPGTRGRVYDRDGDVLATSVQGATVYADPRAFRASELPDGTPVPAGADASVVAAALAEVLGEDPAGIEERLRRDAHFVYLGRQLDHEVGQAVAELELPGIGVLAEPQRVYPAGPLAAQLVGFTDIDGVGLQGVEARYDTVLAGTPGMLALERAPGGLDIASGTRELVPPEVGTDLVLTIDREIQHAAEHAAALAMEEHDAVGASVVVLDVATGDVLGMASAPSYDPNLREGDPADWRNRAVTDVFEPGSAQKALTIAAAIEEGIVTADTASAAQDAVTVGGKRFVDQHPFPDETWTTADIIERSSNVGTIQIAEQLGAARLDDYLRRFGYGATSGLGFPGEAPGLLMPHEQWWGTSLPTIAIGQGVAVTLTQLAAAYATLANDGVAIQPRLVRGTVGADGRLTPSAAPGERRVVASDTARQVRLMLERAVNGEAATGRRAQVDGYRVAGKTGTARKPSSDARGYSSEYMATFVGFAPVESPRIVVAVMVDEPQPIYGGLVAAPVFSEVMGVALRARGVPADDDGQALSTALEVARRQAADAAEATDAVDGTEAVAATEDAALAAATAGGPSATGPATTP